MMFFRPTYIVAQSIVCIMLMSMFASVANAVPTPQFGVAWRKAALEAKLPANMRPSESALEPTSASATLAETEMIVSSTLISATSATAAAQTTALYNPGETSQAQVQASGAVSLTHFGATHMSMGSVAFALIYFLV